MGPHRIYPFTLRSRCRIELAHSYGSAFSGDRYTDTVPATLDLSERLHLSPNAHTRCVNTSAAKPYPPTKYLANHFILLKPEGPEVFRDVNLYGKAMLGTLLTRMVTGSQQGIEVDHN